MKNIILLFCLAVALISGYLILSSLQYSIIDVTAENFKDKFLLYPDKNSNLKEVAIDYCLPENENASGFLPLSLATANIIYKGDSHAYNSDALKTEFTENEKFIKFEINSKQTNLYYTVYFEKSKYFMTSVVIFSQQKTPYVKSIIEKLIINDGFILKKNNQKNGTDIIVKETDNNFIIGEIFNSFDDYPTQLVLSSYQRNKYFRAQSHK